MALSPNEYLWYLELEQDGQKEFLLGILPNKEIDFGEDYDPKAAAKVFWQAVGQNMPAQNPNQPPPAKIIQGIYKEVIDHLEACAPTGTNPRDFIQPIIAHFQDKHDAPLVFVKDQ